MTRTPHQSREPMPLSAQPSALSPALARHLPLCAGLAAFLLLYAGASIRYDGFLSLPVFANLLTGRAVLGLVAVGVAFVILSGGIDLSVGAVMSLSSIVLGVLLMDGAWPLPLAIVATLVIGTCFGFAQGAVIHGTGLKPFIVTLAGMFLARGLGHVIHFESIAITHDAHASIAGWSWPVSVGGSLMFLRPAAVLMLAVAGVGWVIATLTPFGRSVHAVGGDEESARLMGVRVGRTKIATYGISGLCAALAGVVLTFELGAGSHIEGNGLELDAIAAVVIGGTLLRGGVGSVAGTLIGVMTLGVIETAATWESGLNSGLTRVFVGMLLLAFVLVQRWLARSPVA